MAGARGSSGAEAPGLALGRMSAEPVTTSQALGMRAAGRVASAGCPRAGRRAEPCLQFSLSLASYLGLC